MTTAAVTVAYIVIFASHWCQPLSCSSIPTLDPPKRRESPTDIVSSLGYPHDHQQVMRAAPLQICSARLAPSSYITLPISLDRNQKQHVQIQVIDRSDDLARQMGTSGADGPEEGAPGERKGRRCAGRRRVQAGRLVPTPCRQTRPAHHTHSWHVAVFVITQAPRCVTACQIGELERQYRLNIELGSSVPV